MCYNSNFGIGSIYDDVANNTFTQNNCSCNGGWGIYLADANDVVSNNTCCYNTWCGIYWKL